MNEEIYRECIEAPVCINDVCVRDFNDTAVYAGNGYGGVGCGVGGCC